MKPNSIHYLSKDSQNEIITLLGTNITKKILSLVQKSKYFSIILDCTPDVSKTEQMTVIIRFVVIDDKTVDVQEHFLCFIDITFSTGKGMTSYLVNKLKEFNLNIQNLRGQGYDNSANMKGRQNGVQSHILSINPRAFFTPCSAHSLNLVVNDTVKINHQTIKFFGIVQEIYNFFSA